MINGIIYSCLIKLLSFFVGCYLTSSEQYFFQILFYFLSKQKHEQYFFSVTFFNVIFKTIKSLQTIQNVNHIG